ncbi:MAG: class C sortase [Oscillospiraceae bacterium]|nr:class C sortase [Oscillospiraceae bacterium]
MKKHGTTILLILVFVVGLSLLLYPTFSDWWNSMHQSRAVASYVEQVATIDEDQYAELWESAWAFNRELTQRENRYALTEEQITRYEQLLNVGGTGVMGYVEIPEIQVTLPVYHGTDEAVLQIAVGHLEWTSLPVGGEGSHCVISGHRGLPSAKLFTDLDKLVVGDLFMFRVLDEVLTYEVDQILIVEPHEVQDLQVIAGKDLCTLVTCTPYGINSHRLLVRGHRVENPEEAKIVRVTSDAMQIEPMIVAPIAALPMLLVLLIGILIPKRKNRRYDQW